VTSATTSTMLTIHLVAENSVYDSMLALVQEDGPTSMYSLEVSSFMSFIVSYKKLNFQGYLLSVYI